MKRGRTIILVGVLGLVALLLAGSAGAFPPERPMAQGGAPPLISYQGLVKVDGTPFNGTGQFKFAIVNAAGDTTYWSNDGTSTGGSEPTAFVSLSVADGLFNVLLGDTTLGGMTQALSASVFSDTDRYLRVWFNKGSTGFEQLSPDQRIASVPYALQAEEAVNADTVDGQEATAFAAAGHNHDAAYINDGAGEINASNDFNFTSSTHITNLDADLVDGQHASAFLTSSSDYGRSGVATDLYEGTSTLSSKYVNEGQSDSITTGMITDGQVQTADLANDAVTYAKLQDPLMVGAFTWDIQGSGGTIFPVVAIENTSSSSTEWADALWVWSPATQHSNTTALYARTHKGKGIYVEKKVDDNEYAVYVETYSDTGEGLYVNGTIVASGAKSSVVQTSRGMEPLFAIESPEVEFYFNGTDQLVDGAAYVSFDRLFREAISSQVPVRVFLTPVGGWSGLYVESVTSEGFQVRSGAGDPNVAFNWLAVGRRKGCEESPQITIPDMAQEQAIMAAKEQAMMAAREGTR